jgi:hypothetical protein
LVHIGVKFIITIRGLSRTNCGSEHFGKP